MMTPELPKVALIAGPTASGKSALAIELARRTGGTVINADSAQVYAELRVLSARPSTEEEAQSPHRLFGHVTGDQDYSAARWAEEAKAEISAAHARGSLPILAGGTGMYIRTLLDGIAPVPDIAPAIRAEVRALPVVESYRQLAQLDSPAAHRLNPADTTRIARALEVIRSTGRPLADWQAERVGGIADRIVLTPLILLPDRRLARRALRPAADGDVRRGRDRGSAGASHTHRNPHQRARPPRNRGRGDYGATRRKPDPRRSAQSRAGRDPPVCQAAIYLAQAPATG